MNNTEIAAKLDEISGQVSEIKVIAEAVGRHDKSLYGNGQRGLCSRVDQIEVKQTTHIEAHATAPIAASTRYANTVATMAGLVALALLALNVFDRIYG
jgi:hypothetical protein